MQLEENVWLEYPDTKHLIYRKANVQQGINADGKFYLDFSKSPGKNCTVSNDRYFKASRESIIKKLGNIFESMGYTQGVKVKRADGTTFIVGQNWYIADDKVRIMSGGFYFYQPDINSPLPEIIQEKQNISNMNNDLIERVDNGTVVVACTDPEKTRKVFNYAGISTSNLMRGDRGSFYQKQSGRSKGWAGSDDADSDKFRGHYVHRFDWEVLQESSPKTTTVSNTSKSEPLMAKSIRFEVPTLRKGQQIEGKRII